MIYLISTAINQIEELRIDKNDKGQLGIWNFRSPSYTVFHDDDKTFSNIWTQYDPSFSVFHKPSYLRILRNMGA